MSTKPPNLLQKIARKAIRELINEVNTHKKSQSAKQIASKSEVRSSRSKIKKRKQTRSRHIQASTRVSVLNRDKYKCVFCGRNSKQIDLEVDHIIPFSKGGSNDITNLQTLCFDCNRGKGSRQLD
jgi:5-methylcytosine-specific restriction enzyme A